MWAQHRPHYCLIHQDQLYQCMCISSISSSTTFSTLYYITQNDFWCTLVDGIAIMCTNLHLPHSYAVFYHSIVDEVSSTSFFAFSLSERKCTINRYGMHMHIASMLMISNGCNLLIIVCYFLHWGFLYRPYPLQLVDGQFFM